jgi:hypothetical protein
VCCSRSLTVVTNEEKDVVRVGAEDLQVWSEGVPRLSSALSVRHRTDEVRVGVDTVGVSLRVATFDEARFANGV